jgi:hypothetical protein
MPMLLADAATNVDLWTISAPTAANAMQVAYVKYDGKPGLLQLTSKADLGSMTTPWMPNVFKGTGNESRVTMTANVPDAVREHMELVEERIRDRVRPSVPKIDYLAQLDEAE